MVWQKIEINIWDKKEVGDWIKGSYIAKQEQAGLYGATAHKIKLEDGNQLTIFGNPSLNDKMRLVNFGDNIKIIYLGKAKNKKYDDYDVYRHL